jgi:hypothetical protein
MLRQHARRLIGLLAICRLLVGGGAGRIILARYGGFCGHACRSSTKPRHPQGTRIVRRRFAAPLRTLFAVVLLATMVTSAAPARVAEAEGPNAVQNLAGCTTNSLPRGDDNSAGPINLGFTVNFFGTNRSQVFVNNNGNVTFGVANDRFTPFDLTHSTIPIIAVFFTDVLTTDAASGVTTYGTTTFNGHNAFCVNWLHVFGFGQPTTLYDSFQLLIVDLGSGNFDMIFNYDKIQWDTGTFNGNTISAGVGYSAGTGAPSSFFQVDGSLQSGAFLDTGPKALTRNQINSANQLGRFIFHGGQPGGTISGKVTNAAGQGLSGAQVQACINQTGGACPFTGQTDVGGNYSAIGLPAGQYRVKVFPPAGSTGLQDRTTSAFNLAAGQQLTQNITLPASTAPPPAGVLVTQNGITSPPGTVPHLNWGSSFVLTLTAPAAAPGCHYTYHLFNSAGTDVLNGAMTESPPGTYTATVPLHPGGPHGFHHVTFTAAAGDPVPPCVTIDGGLIYIDPSGVVQTPGGSPVVGATVTLFRSDTGETGTFVQVPNGSAIMSPGNRTNPDLTDSAGHFGWDVIAGFYFVRAAKAGCGSVDTAILHILDVPVTDLVLRLNCSGGTSLVGDYNADRLVDIRDYGVWRQNFGATTAGNPADGNLDGRVDILDYGAWRLHFGESGDAAPRPAVEAQPAPPTPTRVPAAPTPTRGPAAPAAPTTSAPTTKP